MYCARIYLHVAIHVPYALYTPTSHEYYDYRYDWKRIIHHLLELQPCREIGKVELFTKVIGVEWNAEADTFRLIIV